MVLIPRTPGNDNVQHQYAASGSLATGGSIVRLNSEGDVDLVTTSGQRPYAMLFQRVKSVTPGLPEGHQFPGEIGNSDALLGQPVQCYQDGGTYETDNYVIVGSGVDANTMLYARIGSANDNGKLTDDTSSVADNGDGATALAVAVVVDPLSQEAIDAGEKLKIKLLI